MLSSRTSLMVSMPFVSLCFFFIFSFVLCLTVPRYPSQTHTPTIRSSLPAPSESQCPRNPGKALSRCSQQEGLQTGQYTLLGGGEKAAHQGGDGPRREDTGKGAEREGGAQGRCKAGCPRCKGACCQGQGSPSSVESRHVQVLG